METSMNYADHHQNLVDLKEVMRRDGLLKDSYVNVVNALITTTKKQAERQGVKTTPTLDKIRERLKQQQEQAAKGDKK